MNLSFKCTKAYYLFSSILADYETQMSIISRSSIKYPKNKNETFIQQF
jgi:hypothetical protein